MIGIYYFKNLITNEMYIGQSNNIKRRIAQHLCASKKPSSNKFYQNIQQYGIQNFQIGVLEECSVEDLDDREKYYIQLFDTQQHGLNTQKGGTNVCGSNNPNTNLTDEIVLSIRQRIYNQQEYIWDVYQEYQHLVSRDSFWSLVHGITWQHVDRSMIYSLNSAATSGEKNPRTKLTNEDVYEIRLRVNSGETPQEVYKDYCQYISFSAFYKITSNSTWKDIVVPVWEKGKPERQGKPKAKLTKEDVEYMRNCGKTWQELSTEYPQVTPITIKRVLNNQTWKNI